MRWLECSTLAEGEAVDAVAELFTRWGHGVAIEEPLVSSADGESVQIDPARPARVTTYIPLDEHAEERRARLEEGIWHLGLLRSVAPLRVRSLDEQDWANAWKEHFFVHPVGRRLVIVPSWRPYQPANDEIALLLDPGMAFGTGLHPTTALCLRALEDLIGGGETVLDLGTGSGILAIAAARLGAARVTALDVDPLAARVAAENVRRNGVQNRVQVAEGSLPSALVAPASCNLAVANITRRALLELERPLADVLRGGGVAVLSGVLADERAPFLNALRAAGWRERRVDQEGDWIALIVERRVEPARLGHR